MGRKKYPQLGLVEQMTISVVQYYDKEEANKVNFCSVCLASLMVNSFNSTGWVSGLELCKVDLQQQCGGCCCIKRSGL